MVEMNQKRVNFIAELMRNDAWEPGVLVPALGALWHPAVSQKSRTKEVNRVARQAFRLVIKKK